MTIVSAGARITGSFGFERFGAGLASGDFNGDGVADLAVNFRSVGSSRADSISTVQVIYGGDGVLEGELDSALLAGGRVTTSGVTDIGVGVDVPGPLSFSDVNDDGFADLLIGAPRAQSGSALTGGAGYILFGADADSFSFGLTNLTNGTDGQAFFSTGGRNAGSSIVDLGDVDGDGSAELLVGVPFAPAPDGSASSGLAYVFDRGEDPVTDLAGAFSDPPAPEATILFSSERAFIAEDATAVGDVNGDDIADFLVTGAGAIGAGAGLFTGDNGEAYLIYGQNGGLPDRIDVSALDGALGTQIIATDIFRIANQVASAGDVNGDGLGDFILLDAGAGMDEPIFYVVYGREGGLGPSFDLSTSDGVSKLGGVSSASPTDGIDMTGVGDVNGDGFGDILVSRAGEGPNGAGEVTLLFGSAAGLGDTVDLDDLAEGAGYRIIGGDNDFRAGKALAGPGDLNDDGVDDFVIGVTGYNPDSNAAFEFDAPGAAYIVYGGAERLAALDVVDGEDGVISLDSVPGDIELPDAPAPAIYSLGPDISIAERNGEDTTFAVIVTRTDTAGAAEIALSISGEATIASGDIAQIGGSTVFADGDSQTEILFRVADDLVEEMTESAIFDLALISSDAPGVIGDGQQIVMIEDDDAPATYNLGPDFTVIEMNGHDTIFAIQITRSNGAGVAEVALATSGSATFGGAEPDFEQIGGSGRFDDGETETSIQFRVIDDLRVEFAEEAIFDLSLVGAEAPAVIGDGQQTVTINDDDQISFFSLGQDFSVAERNGEDTTFAITVTRSFAGGAAEVALTPSGSAATFTTDADFTRIGGSNTFADGETETTVLYRVTDDLRVEFAEEAIFDLSIVSSDAAAEITDGQQTVTINDDDQISFFSLGDDFSIAERNGQDTSFAVNVTRTVTLGEAEIALGVSGPGATDAFRFVGSNTFADGEAETRIIFRLIDDREQEATEDLILDLTVVSSDAPGEVADGQQVVSILDDDTPVIFSLDPDLSFVEGTGRNAQINTFISRSSGAGEAVVNVTLGGTATAFGPNRDYELLTPSVTFADGETLKQVSLILVADSVDEPDETISLGVNVVSSLGVAVVEDGVQVITIEDDDDPAPISGGAGDDSLVGGVGEDRIAGRAGNDTVFGLGGDDFVIGGTGRDRLFGGTGDDTVNAGADDDLVVGGQGDDRLNGQSGADTLRGGAGDDSIIAGRGDDLALGGDGDDAISGGEGRDEINGEAGADRLFGGSGGDTLRGGDGDDRLEGGADADLLFGNGGGDTLLGDAGFDQLFGGSGDDLIFGGSGPDIIRGGSGNDILFGGSGDDRLFGDVGDDILFGRSGRDELTGGAGADRLIGGGGNDRLFGGEGRDTISGGSGADFIRGGAQADLISGGGGDDVLSGEAGGDLLNGGTGSDNILGGSGRDVIIGGGGDDNLVGGGGRDVFVFSASSGDDLIRDFRNGVDRIEITEGAERFQDLQISTSAGDAVISFGGAVIELQRFDASLLDASDFVFS